jgi:predicted nucleic acid-binding protein
MLGVYVVDSSVAVKWYLKEIYYESAIRLLNPTCTLHIPELFRLEVSNVVCKKLRRQEVAKVDAEFILSHLETIPFQWHRDKPLIASAIDIANQTARSLYDCLYLSLAIKIQGQMVTADRKFYDALQPTAFTDKVLWIEDVN